jgi:hypothetical protein
MANSGTLLVAFLLKVLVVVVLAGAAFGHYFLQLRKDEVDLSSESRSRGLGQPILATLVTLVLAVAFWNVGSPQKVRLRRLDTQRVQDLQGIQRAVARYADKHGKLPSNLAECSVDPDTYVDAGKDPETHVPYRFGLLDSNHFELGATFALPTPAIGTESGFWVHPAGPSVFKIEWKPGQPASFH